MGNETQAANETPAQQTTQGQAPATPTPGSASVLNPSRNSSYDLMRRELLDKWANEDAGEEALEAPEPPPAAAGEAEEAEAAANAEAQEVQPTATPTPEPEGAASVEAEAATGEAEQTPTRPEKGQEAVQQDEPQPEARGEPEKPKRFTAKVGDKDWREPDGLTLTFKADGQERTYSLDEVVRLAQLGENYGRRSRELADRARALEQDYQRRVSQAQLQLQRQQVQLLETIRKFMEDEEYREQVLEEYQRLHEHPEEIQLRLDAQRAQELERQLRQRQQQELLDWNRKVWQTVDSIIQEKASEYPYADPDRVRQRFYQAYQQRGKDAISEPFLVDLIREEHEAVARHVEAARQQALKEAEARLAQQRAAAVVEAKNQITDQALKREVAARKVVSGAGTAAPTAPKVSYPKTFKDAARALRDWAEK